MATVTVNSFDEFVAAAAVAGDTVVCPVKAKWELNDLYPEGYNGDINLHCAEIQGNGTTINNLHIFGRFYKKYELHINDLNITNFVCEPSSATTKKQSGFIGSDGSDTGDLYLDGCIMSGVCSAQIERFSYKNPNLNRCSFNIQFTTSRENATGIFPVASARYCRIRQDNTAMSNTTTINFTGCSFCEIDFHWESAVYAKVVNVGGSSGCKIIGNAGAARTQNSGGSPTFPSIIIDTFSENQSALTLCPAVTFAQMYDASYLASLGFPVGVS